MRHVHATRQRDVADDGRDPIEDWRMITLEAGVLWRSGARLHDQQDRFVMIVKRVLRRIEPAKEEPEDRTHAKEEEEKRGGQASSEERRPPIPSDYREQT